MNVQIERRLRATVVRRLPGVLVLLSAPACGGLEIGSIPDGGDNSGRENGSGATYVAGTVGSSSGSSVASGVSSVVTATGSSGGKGSIGVGGSSAGGGVGAPAGFSSGTSTSEPAPAGSPCDTPSMTSVSFATDIMPILQSSCSIGGMFDGLCHGDSLVASMDEPGGQRQYFGPPTPPVTATTTPSIATVYAGIVGAVSFDDPSMSIVTPGSPTNSFLWYKINGVQTQIEVMTPDPCERGDFGNCGSPMPLPLTGAAITLLSQADRDLICNWIVQGAPSN